MEVIRWNMLILVIIVEYLRPIRCQYPAEPNNDLRTVEDTSKAEDFGEKAAYNGFIEQPALDDAGEVKMIEDEGKAQAPAEKLSLTIKDSGVMDLHRGDIALMFYVTALNTGQETIHLNVIGKKCCQKITPLDEDCESMVLIGGDMGDLHPGDTRNLTLFYPNMYLHDRIGFCDINIISETGGLMQYKIEFDTTLPRRGHIPPLLQNYFTLNELTTCKSVDENPLNECQPVDCDMKYNGQRSFFNHTSRRCEEVPECISEQESDLPDVVYVPDTNKCRKLSDHLTDDDYSWFEESKKAETLAHLHSYPMNVRCNHGQPNLENGWCDCEPGWTSASFDHATFNPDTMIYHMCNIWIGNGKATEDEGIMISEEQRHVMIIVFIIMTVIIVVVIILRLACHCVQHRKLHRKRN